MRWRRLNVFENEGDVDELLHWGTMRGGGRTLDCLARKNIFFEADTRANNDAASPRVPEPVRFRARFVSDENHWLTIRVPFLPLILRRVDPCAAPKHTKVGDVGGATVK